MGRLIRLLIRSPMFLLAFVLVTFSLFTVALAQGVPSGIAVTFDNIKLAATNPLTMAGLIVTGVADVRAWWKNPDGSPKIDGKIMVTALAVILGAVIGTFFQLIGWLAVEPFTTWGTPWGGVSYGAAMGVFARYGFNVIDLLINRHATAKAAAANPPQPSP